MTLPLLLIIMFIVTLVVLRFLAVALPYDNPYELRDEELWASTEPLVCTRCGEEQGVEEILERGGSWEDDGFVHTDSGSVFCGNCFLDRDKYGEPYHSDREEMIANPSNYLPRGH